MQFCFHMGEGNEGQVMLEVCILSIISFIATNIDDMIINTFFFVSAERKKDIYSIIFGKYLGMGALVLLSMIGAAGLGYLPVQYIGYLGIIPIILGVKEMISNGKNGGESKYEVDSEMNPVINPEMGAVNNRKLLVTVAAVTIANGSDNIGVYVPMFTGFSVTEYAVCLLVFVIMTAVWCLLGYKLSGIPVLKGKIEKYKNVIVPAVYVLLGVYILLKHSTGLYGLFRKYHRVYRWV